MLNQVIIHGRFVRDPELRRTQSGTAVTTFSLAVSRPPRKSDLEVITDFLNVVAWNGAAETITRYMHKGSEIIINGTLQVRSWEDHDGTKRYTTEIIVNTFDFVGGSRPTESPHAPAPTDADAFTEMTEEAEEDLPF